MKKTIAVVGTLDTKGEEHAFLAAAIRKRGHRVLLIDVGTLKEPQVKPDVTRYEVAAAAGIDLDAVTAPRDRGQAVGAMSKAVAAYLAGLHREGRVDGVVSLGGGGGTALGTSAMKALPAGFPKLMVSTLAGGDMEPYVGKTDIIMCPSIVDIAGLNSVSRVIFTRAAGAICGMVEVE